MRPIDGPCLAVLFVQSFQRRAGPLIMPAAGVTRRPLSPRATSNGQPATGNGQRSDDGKSGLLRATAHSTERGPLPSAPVAYSLVLRYLATAWLSNPLTAASKLFDCMITTATSVAAAHAPRQLLMSNLSILPNTAPCSQAIASLPQTWPQRRKRHENHLFRTMSCWLLNVQAPQSRSSVSRRCICRTEPYK